MSSNKEVKLNVKNDKIQSQISQSTQPQQSQSVSEIKPKTTGGGLLRVNMNDIKATNKTNLIKSQQNNVINTIPIELLIPKEITIQNQYDILIRKLKKSEILFQTLYKQIRKNIEIIQSICIYGFSVAANELFNAYNEYEQLVLTLIDNHFIESIELKISNKLFSMKHYILELFHTIINTKDNELLTNLQKEGFSLMQVSNIHTIFHLFIHLFILYCLFLLTLL